MNRVDVISLTDMIRRMFPMSSDICEERMMCESVRRCTTTKV